MTKKGAPSHFRKKRRCPGPIGTEVSVAISNSFQKCNSGCRIDVRGDVKGSGESDGSDTFLLAQLQDRRLRPRRLITKEEPSSCFRFTMSFVLALPEVWLANHHALSQLHWHLWSLLSPVSRVLTQKQCTISSGLAAL